MRVRDCMTRDVVVASPGDTLCDAAIKMVGMITDRDIAVRAAARNLGPETPVRKARPDAPLSA